MVIIEVMRILNDLQLLFKQIQLLFNCDILISTLIYSHAINIAVDPILLIDRQSLINNRFNPKIAIAVSLLSFSDSTKFLSQIITIFFDAPIR